jgi:S-methylmethionine-dependent homocysteine/selenocysteine methylase
VARRFNAGLVLESATWRASADWAARLGYSRAALAAANRSSIDLLEEIRGEFETDRSKIVISRNSTLAGGFKNFPPDS